MNTHLLLNRYRGQANYGEIAKDAAKAAQANPAMTEAELLAYIESRYAPATLLQPMKQAAPLAVFGADLIDPGAFAQMYSVLRLPVAVRGALMPDGHQGYAMPIGGVAILRDAVSPSFVGYDIGCMMMVSTFEITPQDFAGSRPALAAALRNVTSFGLGAMTPAAQGRFDHPVMDDPRWSETAILRSLKPLAREQLGSSGGGNHFADLCEVTWATGRDAQIALMTHSGSRAAGHKLATHYVSVARRETAAIARGIEPGYEWLPDSSEAGQEYLAAMQLMGDYARANHECIHAAYAEAIGVRPDWTVWNRHNFAWVEEEGIVHRKGATPARAGDIGIIPGSSGTPSYIVRGKGNVASINSSSHGAGRPFSRSEAKRRHNAGQVDGWMTEHDVLSFGLAPDETYAAYKDIAAVMAAQTDLVDIVATLIPRVVVMGGPADDGD